MSPTDYPKLVKVYKAHGKLDAEIIKAFLEAQGIEAYLDQNALGQIYGLTVGDLGEVGVLVDQQDESKALLILRAMEEGEFANEILVDENLATIEQIDQTFQEVPETRKRVLFLCTGNSCRSQMAEAIVNSELGDEWIAFSAGTEPAKSVHPMAKEAIREAGIIHNGYAKSLEVFKGQDFDLVITLCDHARQSCPLWLSKGHAVHIGFEDPVQFQGSEEEKYLEFLKTFDNIHDTILPYLRNL
ncbi:MAG: DUF2007 domain-containing protein [Anaerolineaceae bacterium]|nr:DUF2007 domain-containing protein [Anaerolineaceae bacterium]